MSKILRVKNILNNVGSISDGRILVRVERLSLASIPPSVQEVIYNGVLTSDPMDFMVEPGVYDVTLTDLLVPDCTRKYSDPEISGDYITIADECDMTVTNIQVIYPEPPDESTYGDEYSPQYG